MSRDNPTLNDFRLREACILENALHEMKLIQHHHSDLAELAGLRWGMLSTHNTKTRRLLIEEALSKGMSIDILRATAIQFSNIDLLKDLCLIEPINWKTAQVNFLTHEELVKNKDSLAFTEQSQSSLVFEQEKRLKTTPTLLEFVLSQNNPTFFKELLDSKFSSPISQNIKIQSAILPSLLNQEGYSPLGLALAMGSDKIAKEWVSIYGWPSSVDEVQPLLLASSFGFAEKNLSFSWISEVLKRGAKWGETEFGLQNLTHPVFSNLMTLKFIQKRILDDTDSHQTPPQSKKDRVHSVERDLILSGLQNHAVSVPAKQMKSWIKDWVSQSPEIAEKLWTFKPASNQSGFKQSYPWIVKYLKLEDPKLVLVETMLTDFLENTHDEDNSPERFAKTKALCSTHSQAVNTFSIQDFHAWLKDLRQGNWLTGFTWREEKTWRNLKEISNFLSEQDAPLRWSMLEHLEEIIKEKTVSSKEQEKLFWETPPSPAKKMKKTL